jgi:multiple sugar transport system ATP-binding protein
MVFQNYALYPHMTVFDNMAFSLKMAREERTIIKEKVEKAAEILELSAYLDRKPAALSGGQRQRVAMGRAIVRNPSVFLFDEPLSNLDAQLRTQMRMELKKLHLKMSTTTIYVTHDQIEAMTLADRIVILKDGYIQQVGTPVDVYERPVNRFVASFIGNPPINILPATVKRKEGKPSAIILGGFTLPLSLPSSCNDGRKILVGIRPEAIKRADDFQSGGWQIEATVVVAEILGGRSLLEFTYGAEVSMIAEIEGQIQTKPGENMALFIDTNSLLIFDPETEQAIY